ncbi:hypothetical protein GCM10011402_04930 [Paracoccus acridae]|uniref:Uncharacterized protein n=1 Tax=Paracoccus acridae TaxID=1795310 RepID=A0ABQ1VF97_9RHOB|nr:hypothetical protein [Paracoccus acridae]GGF56006.1 hypothetical protein GCM10011402_04930 [Paracoccus acridae]
MADNASSVRITKEGQNTPLLSDGKIALGIVVGVVLSTLGYLSLTTITNIEITSQALGTVTAFSSLIIACGSMLVAARALSEQRKSREAATDPVLVAHFSQREDARELITFRISNVGAGAALNVILDVTQPEDDISRRKIITNIFQRHHPFRIIPQGQSIEFSFALGWEVLGDKPLPPFVAKLAYEDLSAVRYEGYFMLDIKEMEKLGANKSPQMRLVSAVEKIERHLAK